MDQSHTIDPIAHIRKNVLDISQAELASIAGVAQPTVSRWEKGELHPNREEYRRIKQAVVDKGAAWDDGWILAPSIEVAGAAA